MDQHSPAWKRSFALAAVAAVIVMTTGGAIYGRLTQRWGAPPRMKEAGAHLLTFPTSLGDWDLQSEVPIEESVTTMLACDTFVNRNYANRQTGDVVNLSLFVGPAGPTAVHTPEVCLSSRDYILQGKRKKESITPTKGADEDFWGVTFDSKRVGGAPLRVYYAWQANEGWRAPEYPRFEYGAAPMLYKIQITGNVDPAALPKEGDPCRQFLDALAKSGWKPMQD